MSTSTYAASYAASAALWVIGLAAAGWGSGLIIAAAKNRLTNRGAGK